MRIPGNVLLLAAPLAIITAAYPIDFAGYVYYSGCYLEEPDSAGHPLYQGSVTLWKWTAEGTWEQVGSAYPTDEYGYYHFDGVSGTGVTWFKIRINAKDKIPGWTEDYWVQERIAKKEIRPVGIPDAGKIRVDVLFAGNYQLLEEEPESPWYRGFEGHYVHFLDGTNEMPTLGLLQCPPGNDATCPPTENELWFKGCATGHWYSWPPAVPEEGWDTAAWAHFTFREPAEEPPGDAYGDGYYFWDPAQPWWATCGTGFGDGLYKVVIDFVGKALP